MVKINAKVEFSDLHSVAEVATLLGKSEMTIWRWIRENKIAVIRFSNRTLIPQSEIGRRRDEDATQPLPLD